jgi:hypothetical protein
MAQTTHATWKANQTLPIVALAGRLSLAWFYVLINLNIGVFGLGWAIRPGFLVATILIGVGIFEFIKTEKMYVFGALISVMGTLFVEFLPLSRSGSAFLGLVLNLIGNYAFFKIVNRVRLAEIIFLVVAAYIDAVFIFNLFRGEQMMFFFKHGWTT